MFDTNDLPKFKLKKSLNVSGKKIFFQLNKYLAFKRAKLTDHQAQENCVLPFNSQKGLCAGLTAYWLYCKCAREEWVFFDHLEYLLAWNKNSNPAASEDQKIEDFLNVAGFLQFDTKLRPGVVRNGDINQSLNFLLPEYNQQVNEAEFKTTFVFTTESLSRMLDNTVLPNKMVRVSSFEHTLGLVYSGDIYYLYDFESKYGPQQYDNVNDLSKAIFKALVLSRKTKQYLAMNLSVFDFKSRPKGRYPQTTGYFEKLTKNLNYQQALLKDPHIFNLAVEYRNTELAHYLIEQGMDPNILTSSGITPLESALIYNEPELFYKLLKAGANPNLPTSTGISLWKLAVRQENNQALIMLAGLCLEIDDNPRSNMVRMDSNTRKTIIHHAILLNQKALNAPSELMLPQAHMQDIVAFLRHIKLKTQFGYDVVNIFVQFNGIRFNGNHALEKIAEHCQTLHDEDLFCVAQKKEAYVLINNLMKNHIGFDYYQELLKNIEAIEKKIMALNIQQSSPVDLQNIATALKQLHTLSGHLDTINPQKKNIAYQASAVKKRIERHLAKNGISLQPQSLEPYQAKHVFFSPNEHPTPPISYMQDVAPLLNVSQPSPKF